MRGRHVLLPFLLLCCASAARAQTTGSLRGMVVDRTTHAPLSGAQLRVSPYAQTTRTDASGRFVFLSLPAGSITLVVEALGYAQRQLDSIPVRVGRASELTIELDPSAIQLEAVTGRASGVKLIEPTVSSSHTSIDADQLRELPVDNIAQAIELAPGVSNGHFRGGRIGQETYVVDGVELKNQLEASRQGAGIEFSPSSLEQVDVVTGGFGAEYGSALSGVVSLVTRRGSPERWDGRASVSTDQWAPASLFYGFSSLSLSAGGPLRFLGRGTTVFADVLAQGLLDAEPRARGLTCLDSGGEGPLAARIRELRADPATAALLCPDVSAMLPHQAGDKWIGFARVDRPLGAAANLSASILHNRFQRQLYTSEFKYNAEYQLGQRTTSDLGTLSLDWTRNAEGRALRFTARGAALRMRRHLGALSLEDLAARSTVAGFGLEAFDFIGEDFVHRPILEQLETPAPVPGHSAPGGAIGSPFGPAAEGILVTEGTPGVVNWSSLEMLGGDAAGELVTTRGLQLKVGGAGKFYRIESYERVLPSLPAAALQYARFFPATADAFAQTRIQTDDDIQFEIGARIEAFRSGIAYRPDRDDFLSPVIETSWKRAFMPRIALAAPFPGGGGRTAVRMNYGAVSQPPDFRYFVDSSLGDSLRTDLQQQGNPNLSFERGTAFEVGISHLLTQSFGITLTGFNKQLRNLATAAVGLSQLATGRASVNDFGRVQGLELVLRARGTWLSGEVGYALQRALGVTNGSDADTVATGDAPPREVPLAFDRRHSIDLALYFGAAAGDARNPWSAALTASAQSGYPIARSVLGLEDETELDRLPWTTLVDLRAARDIAHLPHCASCRIRALVDARNLAGADNLLGVRSETGTVAPRLSDVESLAAMPPGEFREIPRESPRYSVYADLDRDGRITETEFRTARFAAALDRYDPSLFYAQPRQVRFGVEVTF